MLRSERLFYRERECNRFVLRQYRSAFVQESNRTLLPRFSAGDGARYGQSTRFGTHLFGNRQNTGADRCVAWRTTSVGMGRTATTVRNCIQRSTTFGDPG